MPPCVRMTPRIPISIANQLGNSTNQIVRIHQLKKNVIRRKIPISANIQRPALAKVSNFEGFTVIRYFLTGPNSNQTVLSKFLFF